MKTVITIAGLVTLVAFSTPALAEKNDSDSTPPPGYAGLCYEQTLRLDNGTPADELSITPCIRALRERSRDRNKHSLVYHNRGVIEEAQGKSDAAYASFSKAVALSRQVDLRNVALAQMALQHGDHGVALEQYELLLGADAKGLSEDELAVVGRNRVRVVRMLEQTRVVKRQ